MYYEGIGTVMDKAKALYWYEKAAEQEYYEAMRKCEYMYEDGDGIKANKAKANYWRQKCIEQDKAFARDFLGLK